MKLEINWKKKTEKHRKPRRLNNMLLNNKWLIMRLIEEIKKCLETNENENTMTQNLWNSTKAVLKKKFIAREAYLEQLKKSQINNSTLYLKKLEKNKNKKRP